VASFDCSSNNYEVMDALMQQHIGHACKNIDGCGQGSYVMLVGYVGDSEIDLSIAHIAKTGRALTRTLSV
jgi:hypothetical protein